METKAIECPSCGSGSVIKTSRFAYSCSYCRNEFKHVEVSDVRELSSGLQCAGACSKCGDTRNLKVCMFCKQTFCSTHVKRAGEQEFSICRDCQRDGSGASFLATEELERDGRRRVAAASRQLMEIEVGVESSLTEAFESSRLRAIALASGKYVGISILILLVGSLIGIGWIGVLMLLASIPVGIIRTLKRYDVKEQSIKDSLREKARRDKQQPIDRLNSTISEAKIQIRSAIAERDLILADMMG